MNNTMTASREGSALHLAVAFALLCSATLVLPGCGGGQEFTDLKKTLEEIRQRPRGAVEPPPEFKSHPTYTYSAHKLRSPFQASTGDDVLPAGESKTVAPDLTRPREYLEQFNIEALRMRGTIQKQGQSLAALVDDGSGGIYPVRVGNYLGKNFGRVVAIEDARISVMEIVPDGHDGWVERPRIIRLEGE